MAPRYQTNKGYNNYNKGKLFENDEPPFIINKYFLKIKITEI